MESEQQGMNWDASDPLIEQSVRRNSQEQYLAQTCQNGQIQTERGIIGREEWSGTFIKEDGIKTSQNAVEEWSFPENWDQTTVWDMQQNSAVTLPQEDRECLTTDTAPPRDGSEDLGTEVNLNYPAMTDEEREEMEQQLAKLEEEIGTLRQVLSSKEKQHADLKQKLGITPLSELRNNFSRSWMDMQSSTAYKKTSETLSTAGNKTSAAFNTLGNAITKKFGDMSYSIQQSMSMPTMRNSPSFKSFEEKVENTVSTIKTKVGGSGGEGSFQDVLSSAANATSHDHHQQD